MTGVLFGALAAAAGAQEAGHSHPAPEKLGTVHFANSCAPAVQQPFDRAIALLHSFTYEAAQTGFRAVLTQDPGCALAHWGIAMSLWHPLWSPPGKQALEVGRAELLAASELRAPTTRERQLIDAALTFFSDADPAHHASRARAYEASMARVAQQFATDDELQILHALALLAVAEPTDSSHAKQKQAAGILEPIYRRLPDHPGVAHYLIHACDSAELARRGLPAARAYAKIAPSAPHALHMPSHIFTRLGLWQESVASNEAARRAAHEQGDLGEQLHAMDYLTYALLQQGRNDDAARVVEELRSLNPHSAQDFKVGYAATAMPVRIAVEQGRWDDALALQELPGSAPHVAAIVYWARAIAAAHRGDVQRASAELAKIEACEFREHAGGDAYWGTQIGVLAGEVRAWSAYALGRREAALSLMRGAADVEDSLEKLPVTPGPIVPAREQLGQMLLGVQQPAAALVELRQALRDAPRRRAAIEAAVRAAEETGDPNAAAEFRNQLNPG